MTNHINFLYQKGRRVRHKVTGKVGMVERCDTEPTIGTPFYYVRFDDGTTDNVAESDLWPA
jgi:hypothetical protein